MAYSFNAQNSRLGGMFLWIGCGCQLLWTCASLSLKAEYRLGDYTPLFIYSALALAGVALTVPSHQFGDWSRRRSDVAQRVLARVRMETPVEFRTPIHVGAEARVMIIG